MWCVPVYMCFVCVCVCVCVAMAMEKGILVVGLCCIVLIYVSGCTYTRMHACMHACMCVCVCVWVCVYVHMYVPEAMHIILFSREEEMKMIAFS